jgi:hypothetical protein
LENDYQAFLSLLKMNLGLKTFPEPLKAYPKEGSSMMDRTWN